MLIDTGELALRKISADEQAQSDMTYSLRFQPDQQIYYLAGLEVCKAPQLSCPPKLDLEKYTRQAKPCLPAR
jgi:hypothetical protein